MLILEQWLVGQIVRVGQNVWSGKWKISIKLGEMVGRGIGTILLQVGQLVIGQMAVGET
jgi:hypothetical protein